MSTNLMIDVAGLRKSFGDNAVLDGIDLTVSTGTVHALLGPNGAGKTTIVTILSTLLSPDGGRIAVAGFDPVSRADDVRRHIGVTGQFSAVDDLLTARENLRLMADLAHLDRSDATRTVADLLGRFDLGDAADRRVSTFSGGMRRRLDLAMTLVGRPRLIFLDEPTTGLDPRSRRELWQIVREQIADGVTVLLTTQYLEEADQLADQISVLDGGRIVAEGTPTELKRTVPGGHVVVHGTSPSAVRAIAADHPGAVSDETALTVHISNDGSVRSLRALLAELDDDAVVDVTVHEPDLDDVFLALTGHGTTEVAR